jgi:hypothetical protein
VTFLVVLTPIFIKTEEAEMQKQQEFGSYHPKSNPDPNVSEEQLLAFDERSFNADPREQRQAPFQKDVNRSYGAGYVGLDEQDFWPREGEKLRPVPPQRKNIGGLLALVVFIGAAFIAGCLFGLIISWLVWLVVTVLIIAGVIALVRNWCVVTIPLPARSFQIMEHARLVINNRGGRVTIRRGEEGVVSVSPTKRASGLGINLGGMQIDYEQHGDILQISSRTGWHIFQFGLRRIDFDVTVPAGCDVQLHNGSGAVAIQGINGVMRVHTGSGRIYAHDLQGQITVKAGSGRMEIGNLQGQVDLNTSSGRIEASNLKGQIKLHTGSSRIVLNNVRGQLVAQTGSGRIEVTRSALSGESMLKTGSGSMTVEGSLDQLGSYKFQTGSGRINLGLPATAAFSLDAKTGSGGVHNDFGCCEVGNGPRAPLKLRTGSGRIRISCVDMGGEIL